MCSSATDVETVVVAHADFTIMQSVTYIRPPRVHVQDQRSSFSGSLLMESFEPS